MQVHSPSTAAHTVWYWQVVRWGKRNSAVWSLWDLLMLLICLTPKSILCLEPPSLLRYVVFWLYLSASTAVLLYLPSFPVWSSVSSVGQRPSRIGPTQSYCLCVWFISFLYAQNLSRQKMMGSCSRNQCTLLHYRVL